MNKQLTLFKVFMSNDIDDFVTPVLKSGMITQGKQVELFEEKLKEYFNYPYILTLNSATSGLTLAIRMLDLKNGDEIITTSLTCTATNWPILANGVKIRWADVNKDTCNINYQSIRDNLSPKTKAILFVHWGGYPVDLYEIQKIQNECYEKYGFKPAIIEDAAHAFSSKFDGKYIGTHGISNSVVFSLQAIKHLTTGDGGLIFLSNQEDYLRAKKLRWFGIDRETRTTPSGDFRMEPDVPEWGYKFHMNDINASIGIANIRFVKENIEKLKTIANKYNNFFKDDFFKNRLQLLEEDEKCESSRWLYTIKILNNKKQDFINYMKEKNIMTSQVHNRNDKHSCVSEFKTSLPLLDELEKEIICIPAGWWLTDDEQDYILNSIKEWCLKE